MDTEPNFGRYWHFCGTIIDVRTDRNTYKMGMEHYLIQRRIAVDRFYLKVF